MDNILAYTARAIAAIATVGVVLIGLVIILTIVFAKLMNDRHQRVKQRSTSEKFNSNYNNNKQEMYSLH